MSEHVPSKLVVTAATLAAGAFLVSGCTAGGGEKPSDAAVVTMEGDMLPTVDAYADATPLTKYSNTVNMEDLSAAYAADPQAPKKAVFPNLDPITQKPTEYQRGFSTDTPSAPLLDIMLGSDDKLHVQDFSPGKITPDEGKILAAVATDEPYLTSAMRAKRLHKIHFRLNDAGDVQDETTVESYPVAVAQDVRDGMQPNLYYFLPGRGAVDPSAIATLTAHETTHLSLEHGKIDLAKSTATNKVTTPDMTPAEKADFTDLCTNISHAVSEDASDDAWETVSQLRDVEMQVPATYTGVLETVQNAITDGTYYKMPQRSTGEGEIAACYIPSPTEVLHELAAEQNLNMDKFYKVADGDNLVGDNTIDGEIYDTWNNTLDDDTILSTFTESNYLADTDDNENAGHLPDGFDEVEASVAATVLTKTSEVAQHIASEPEDRKQLELRIARSVFGQLKRVYANDPSFIALADQKLQTLTQAVQ